MSEEPRTATKSPSGSAAGYAPVSPAPWRYDAETCELLDARGHRIVTPEDPGELVHSDDLDMFVADGDGRLLAAAPEMMDWIIAALRDPERFTDLELDEAERIYGGRITT